MNVSSMLALLQLAAALLIGVSGSHVSDAAKIRAIGIGSRAVQIAAQAVSRDDSAPFTMSGTIWPNYEALLASHYLNEDGARVPAGSGASLMPLGEYTSFGDLNGDGLDDAAVVVRRLDAGGTPSLALAFMLQQGKMLFNIADLPLGADTITVYDHHVVSGALRMDMATGSGARKVHAYKLLGNKIVEE